MNDELKEIFDSDQGDRKNDSHKNAEVWKTVAASDQSRMKRVKEMINLDLLKTGEDYYHAATVFQHGSTIDDYVTAHELANKSMDLGYDRAKWLYAASLDRLMLERGDSYQKFGTQFKRKTISDPWELCPVDPATTDEERAKYNVPSLEKQREREKELNLEN